jgi:hypothetical protein
MAASVSRIHARERDAGADPDEDLGVGHGQRPAHDGAHAFGDGDRVIGIDQIDAQHHELVGTEAGHRVAGAHRAAQP